MRNVVDRQPFILALACKNTQTSLYNLSFAVFTVGKQLLELVVTQPPKLFLLKYLTWDPKLKLPQGHLLLSLGSIFEPLTHYRAIVLSNKIRFDGF